MYKALDIAFWFILKNNLEQKDYNYNKYVGITNEKIQKMLYLSQCLSFSFFGKPLFSEKIIACKYGPIINEVNKKFKKFGKSFIRLEKVDSFKPKIIREIENDDDTRKILIDVYECLNKFSTFYLFELCCEHGSPWEKSFKSRKENKVIELNQDLIDYFKQNFEEY